MICVCFFPSPALLHHHTPAVPTVWTDRTWTVTFSHVNAVDDGTVEAVEELWVEEVAEFDIDQIIFPAGWAVRGDVLSAH